MQLENLGVLVTEVLKHIDLWVQYVFLAKQIADTVQVSIFFGTIVTVAGMAYR